MIFFFLHINVGREHELLYWTYLLHFQHKGGGICFEIIVHPNPGENLIGNTKRSIVSRYIRAWKMNAKALLQKGKSHIALCSVKFKCSVFDLSEPWSDTAPPVWGRWTFRSCWAQWWWQSCCPQRCSCCLTQAAVQPFAPGLGDDRSWWPVCLWTLGALAGTATEIKLDPTFWRCFDMF